MRKNKKTDFSAIVLLIIVVMIVVGAVAQTPATIDTAGPTAKAPPTPLMGHMLQPTVKWLDDYSDKPVKEVTMCYTVRMLINAANRQQQEIETLKTTVQGLSIDNTALKALVHGIQTGGVDPNSQ